MSIRDYTILGLKSSANEADIKLAFRRLAHAFHPDKGPENQQRFTEVCEAYHRLMARRVSSPSIDRVVVNTLKSKAVAISKERREGRRGSPADRRFNPPLEYEYKGTKVKVSA